MEPASYFKIRVGSLLAEKPIPFDLYVLIGDKQVLYLREGESLGSEKIKKLDGADVFFINANKRAAYKKFVHETLTEETWSITEKAEILRESSLALVEEIFENPNIENALDDSRELISDFVSFIDENPDGAAHLISLSTHDFYTFNHSLDVSVYSLGLGRAVGYSAEDLLELGRGALFHDIGKREVDVNIICKNGALDEIEWAQMQKHPTFGLQILSQYDTSEAMKACCFEHHENFLGSGYPQGLSGEEIHPMARIIALTDTFDALTTQRSYNVPMSPKEALTFITEKLGSKYDPELLKAMNSVLFQMEEAQKAKA